MFKSNLKLRFKTRLSQTKDLKIGTLCPSVWCYTLQLKDGNMSFRIINKSLMSPPVNYRHQCCCWCCCCYQYYQYYSYCYYLLYCQCNVVSMALRMGNLVYSDQCMCNDKKTSLTTLITLCYHFVTIINAVL